MQSNCLIEDLDIENQVIEVQEISYREDGLFVDFLLRQLEDDLEKERLAEKSLRVIAEQTKEIERLSDNLIKEKSLSNKLEEKMRGLLETIEKQKTKIEELEKQKVKSALSLSQADSSAQQVVRIKQCSPHTHSKLFNRLKNHSPSTPASSVSSVSSPVLFSTVTEGGAESGHIPSYIR